MVDSNNIAIIRQNLIELKRQIDALDVEIPSHAAADVGKILAVDASGDLEWKEEYSYTPPAYSSTDEVNTGQKWVDGKDIYCKILSGTFGDSNIGVNVGSIGSDFDDVINIYVKTITSSRNKLVYNGQGVYVNYSGGVIAAPPTATTYEQPFDVIVYYTKTPTPEPGTREDAPIPTDKGTGMITGEDPEPIEEVKETKSRKKSTK